MPELDHSPDDAQVLIDYARREFADESFKLSPALAPGAGAGGAGARVSETGPAASAHAVKI